jgi:hypothetical protein
MDPWNPEEDCIPTEIPEEDRCRCVPRPCHHMVCTCIVVVAHSITRCVLSMTIGCMLLLHAQLC